MFKIINPYRPGAGLMPNYLAGRNRMQYKGIIYSVKYKELDFTVPEFNGFIMRLEEYREWERQRV